MGNHFVELEARSPWARCESKSLMRFRCSPLLPATKFDEYPGTYRYRNSTSSRISLHIRWFGRGRIRTNVLGLFSKYEFRARGDFSHIVKEQPDKIDLYHTRQSISEARLRPNSKVVGFFKVAASFFV